MKSLIKYISMMAIAMVLVGIHGCGDDEESGYV